MQTVVVLNPLWKQLIVLLPSIKGHVRIAEKSDTGDFLLFAISDLTDQGTYWDLNITNEAQGGSALVNNTTAICSFISTGDKGDTGSKGQKGQKGVTGPQGNVGPTGAQGIQGVQRYNWTTR